MGYGGNSEVERRSLFDRNVKRAAVSLGIN